MLNQDYKDMLQNFLEEKVEFVIVVYRPPL